MTNRRLSGWNVTRGLLLAVALVGTGIGSTVRADVPRFSGFRPGGAARGSEVVVRPLGGGLENVEAVIFYQPGITVKKIERNEKDKACDVTLVVAPNCTLGSHAVRVVTSTGVSELGLFSIGALAEVLESEKNDTPETAQQIEIDTTVNGTCGEDDFDYYAIQGRKGERLTAEVEGVRMGRAPFDAYVAWLDASGKELASSDDDVLVKCDPIASFIVPEDGKYLVVVRSSIFTGTGGYRLHVGRYPQPRVAYPPGGTLGSTAKIRLIGDVKGDKEISLTLPKESNDRYAVFAEDETGISPTGIPFRLSKLANTLEAEPNDTPAEATQFSAPGAVNGILQKSGDVDRFRFAAKKGDQFEVRVLARSLRSPLDSILSIEDKNGRVMATNDDMGNMPDSYLRFNAQADGEYVIAVSDMLKQGGPNYVYRVELTPIEPTVTLTLPEIRRYEDVVLPVAQGNRMAIMVNAARRDCAGELAMALEKLPRGLKSESMPVPGNQNQGMVLLSADDRAEIGGALVDLVGRVKNKVGDKEVPVEGHLQQNTLLVRVNNAQSLLTWTETRLATAVVRPAPFKIEVVQPRVPLVRTGAMDLKVRVTRDKDFKAPITLKLVYNPPGVSSSANASIAEGENEGTIPATASKEAELGKWPLVVIAAANIDGRQVEVASQMAVLEVAETFFNFTFKPMSVVQGASTDFVIDVEANQEFVGKVKAELVGLPAEATTSPVEFDNKAEQIKFKIQTTAKTSAGRHKSVMCRAVLTVNGEPVVHVLGPAELRVDAPITKTKNKANDPASAGKADPKAK